MERMLETEILIEIDFDRDFDFDWVHFNRVGRISNELCVPRGDLEVGFSAEGNPPRRAPLRSARHPSREGKRHPCSAPSQLK